MVKLHPEGSALVTVRLPVDVARAITDAAGGQPRARSRTLVAALRAGLPHLQATVPRPDLATA